MSLQIIILIIYISGVIVCSSAGGYIKKSENIEADSGDIAVIVIFAVLWPLAFITGALCKVTKTGMRLYDFLNRHKNN